MTFFRGMSHTSNQCMSLVISDGFCSADYEFGVRNVQSRQVSETDGVLEAKNHIFDHFYEIAVRCAKI